MKLNPVRWTTRPRMKMNYLRYKRMDRALRDEKRLSQSIMFMRWEKRKDWNHTRHQSYDKKGKKKKMSLGWEKMTWTKQVGKLCFWRETKYKRKKTSKKRHLSPKLKSDIIFRTWSFWPPSNPILYIWTSKKWPMKEIKKRKKLIILWKFGRRKWENCNFDNLIK